MAKFFFALLWALFARVCQSEGEESEHTDEKPPLDDVTWTTAFLVIGFLVISVGVLYLVNCQDKDMRKASWALINTTFSIFSAATLDFGIVRLLQLLLPGQHNVYYHLSIACFPIGVLAILLRTLLKAGGHHDHHHMFAVKTLGGHIYAFAAIMVFADLQQCQPFAHQTGEYVSAFWNIWVLLVPFIALLLMGILCLVMQYVCGLGGLVKNSLQWRQALDMQMEASTITVGFLFVQAICFWMSTETAHEKKFMPISHGVPGEHRYQWALWLLAVGLLLFSVFWSIQTSTSPPCAGMRCKRFGEFIGELASVTACWCFQRGGVIFWYGQVKRRMTWYLEEFQCAGPVHCDKEVEVEPEEVTHRAQIVNALCMSVLAVFLLWVIDEIADYLQGEKRCLVRCCQRQYDSDGEDNGSLETLESQEGPEISEVQSQAPTELDAIAHGLREAMSGLGMLVGICWDKAFETAYETVLEDESIDNVVKESDGAHNFIIEYPKTARVMVVALGFSLFLWVVIAWYWHIVPHAMKEEDEHEQDIAAQVESLNYARLPSKSRQVMTDE